MPRLGWHGVDCNGHHKHHETCPLLHVHLMLLLRRQHLMLFWWRKRMFGIHRKAPGILWIVICLRWEVINPEQLLKFKLKFNFVLDWTTKTWPEWKYNLSLEQGYQPPTSSNIENWWGVGDRWHHNAGHIKSFFGKKKCEKDVVLIVTFDLIGLLPTNHIIAYITKAYLSLWGNVQC